jgi:ethanolamine ammonia-lyase small subunit
MSDLSDVSKTVAANQTVAPANDLRRYTPARIALQRTGISIATNDALAFTLAHAQARDAVHARLGAASLLEEVAKRGLKGIRVRSAAPDRATYLRRPDLGRTLTEASMAALQLRNSPVPEEDGRARLTIILADGLSALATERHAVAVLDALLPMVEARWRLTEIVVAEQARVALGDEIAQVLGAEALVVLIGERPGLSAADSLGAYITWQPRPGRTNAERNCISNIRAEGLSPVDAAARIAYYLQAAKELGMSGIALKDPEERARLVGQTGE